VRGMWVEMARDSSRKGGCRKRAIGMTGPSAVKVGCLKAAARARGTTDVPLPVHRLWCAVSAHAAQTGGLTQS